MNLERLNKAGWALVVILNLANLWMWVDGLCKSIRRNEIMYSYGTERLQGLALPHEKVSAAPHEGPDIFFYMLDADNVCKGGK